MKTYRSTLALVVASLLAVAALVVGASALVGLDVVVGFTAALAVLAIAASDYRLGGLKVLGR